MWSPCLKVGEAHVEASRSEQVGGELNRPHRRKTELHILTEHGT